MYIRFSALLSVVGLAAVATAAPTVLEVRATTTTTTTSQCNTGNIQCCNNTYSQTDASVNSLLGLLGIVLPSTSGLLGLGCSSITGVGTGTGATCTQQPVCCSGNTFNGLINIGCSPININLL